MSTFAQTWKKYRHIPFLTATIIAIIIYGVSIFREHHTTWEIIHNLGQDTVISLLFYYVLVYIPEKRRNNRIKKSLSLALEDFKINTIRIFMQAAQVEDTDLESIKKLLDIHAFKKDFTGQRWHDVVKGLSHNKKLLQHVIENITILRRDFLFSLYNADISDNDMYYLIKDSAQSLAQFTYMESGTEDVKSLTDFLWNMFTKTHWVLTSKE